jgi:hypothetical protein
VTTNAPQPDVIVAPDPPRFRWLRRLVVLTLVWAAAMYGLWTWWHRAGAGRIRAEIDTLRARGEPVELGQVRPPMEFDHRSAGADVAAAARMLNEFNRGRGITRGGQPRRLPGEPPAAADGDNNNDAAARVAAVFETARRAATRPVGPLPSPMLTGMSELSQMLRASAVREHHVRRDRESLELIAALLQQADVTFVSGASIQFHQRGVEMRAAAASAAASVAGGLRIEPGAPPPLTPRDSAVSADDVRDLIRRLLDESHMAASFTRAWQAERVYLIYVARAPIYERPPVVVYRHDMIRAIRQTTELVEASRGPSFPRRVVRNVTAPAPPQSALDRWARASSSFHGHREWSPALFAHYSALADGRAAAVQLAIRLYASDHAGAPPPTLDALVPAYLGDVPHDPFAAGRRLTMHRVAERVIVLASVGANGVDDSAAQVSEPGLVRLDPNRTLARQMVHDDPVYSMILPGGSGSGSSSGTATAPSSPR